MSADRALVAVTVLTAFPDLLAGVRADGMVRIALEKVAAELRVVHLRDHTVDRHRTVDDYPYGGGPGMVLKVEPVARALETLPAARQPREVILLTPQGEPLRQTFFEQRATGCDLVLVCGRYKGVDERIRSLVDRELSLGDFVLSGGEVAAMAVIDGLMRLIPGVPGDLDSARGDSFATGILDSAYYTRPEVWREQAVPPVLLSGHHAEIRRWRRQDALARTLARRPDLLAGAALDEEDRRYLRALGWSSPTGGQRARNETDGSDGAPAKRAPRRAGDGG